jgi:hypothetical protein
MDFRPSRDRAMRPAEVDDEGTAALPAHGAHDFDVPAWRSPTGGPRRSTTPWLRNAPRLIDLERRARFARATSDLR